MKSLPRLRPTPAFPVRIRSGAIDLADPGRPPHAARTRPLPGPAGSVPRTGNGGRAPSWSGEVLGYDPENLTPAQRDEVEEATQDPGTNVYIASEYLAQLKAESSFADVPADQMTPAQYQELAARYNGGPGWRTDDAQAYGRGFGYNLDQARRALHD